MKHAVVDLENETYDYKCASFTIVYSEVPSVNQETRLLDTDKQSIEESSSSMNIRCLVVLHLAGFVKSFIQNCG